MKILPVSVSNSTNQSQNKIQQKQGVKNSLSLQSTISVVYPKNYYLSFKGEENSCELNKLEKLAKEYFEKNKDNPEDCLELNEKALPDIYMPKKIKEQYLRDVNKIFDSVTDDKINKKDLAGLFSNILRQTKEKMSSVNLDAGYQDVFDMDVLNFIDDLQEKNRVPKRISLDKPSLEFMKVCSDILASIICQQPEERKDYKYFVRCLVSSFKEQIVKYEKPKPENEFDIELKKVLKQEPYKTYNQRMLKINAQKKLSNLPSLTKTIDSLYNDMINNHINPFDNPKMYDYIIKHDAKLDFLLEQLYGGYENNIYDFLVEKCGLDKKHKALLIDPGMISHYEEFADFIKKEGIDTSKIEPFELRKKFSQYLGTETVYRGIYYYNPRNGIEELKKNGCLASGVENAKSARNALGYFLEPDAFDDVTVRDKLCRKIVRPKDGNDFLSVSSIYEVAASVPKKYVAYVQKYRESFVKHVGLMRNDDSIPEDVVAASPVVVVKADIPKLSIIKQDKMFAHLQNNELNVLHIGDNIYPYETQQDKIEAFVPFFMPTDNAEYKIDTKTAPFYWSID